MTDRIEQTCGAALALPLAVAAALMVWVSVGETFGAAPWSGLIPRNGAEAAGMGSAGDVLRFLRAGEDPHAVYDVRPEVISSAVRKTTILEAAMWSRELELVQLL